MSALSIDAEIQQCLQLLEPEDKKSVLSVIKAFIKTKEGFQAKRLTIEQYNKELADAEAPIHAGNKI